jgi:hypothetical protein
MTPQELTKRKAYTAYWQASIDARLYAFNHPFTGNTDYDNAIGEIINQLNDKCQLALNAYSDLVAEMDAISQEDIIEGS